MSESVDGRLDSVCDVFVGSSISVGRHKGLTTAGQDLG